MVTAILSTNDGSPISFAFRKGSKAFFDNELSGILRKCVTRVPSLDAHDKLAADAVCARDAGELMYQCASGTVRY